MHAVARGYSGPGAKQLFDLLEQHKAEVERLLRGVAGFASYTLARSSDGGFSVTVCADKAGTDASVKIAREWIAANAANTGVGAPTVMEGEVILHLK